MKSWRFLLPVVVFAGLAILLFAGLGKDPSILPSPLIGRKAPEFDLAELRDMTGETRVRSADLRGQPYLLNVWGSWCPTCRFEHPHLMRFASERHLPVVGLNWKDEPDDARRWLTQFGDPYTHIARDETGRTAIDFGVYRAPETFLVSADGVILFKQTGPVDQEVLTREILPLLQKSRGQ